ncbi:MAG: DNA replication and repair protein RecF, partial [Firmicutes bacterium]|nr:DNA replication and repair protein RecF [Bacillota bacterium]
MFVKKLEIKNWRNYDHASITLDKGVNIVLGNNAQGKTNLMEAVYLCSVGRSARTPRDKELIQWGQAQSYVGAVVERRLGSCKIEIIVDQRTNKRVAIGGIPLVKLGELMGECRCVYFSPDELKIIKDAPSERRKFIDIALCQISKPYFYALSEYGKNLAQRNKLLKQYKTSQDTLDIWDAQLAKAGAKIIKSRRGFVRE